METFPSEAHRQSPARQSGSSGSSGSDQAKYSIFKQMAPRNGYFLVLNPHFHVPNQPYNKLRVSRMPGEWSTRRIGLLWTKMEMVGAKNA